MSALAILQITGPLLGLLAVIFFGFLAAHVGAVRGGRA